jgi:gluconokinase
VIILIMGVSGVGKTTVGQALAQQLGWTFADADDFHSPANVAKMRAGIPLTDDDRGPWLESLRTAIEGWLASHQPSVLACSALKQAYRERLIVNTDVKLVFLHADFDLIAGRMDGRHGHYMNPGLLKSQFDTLQPPQDAISIDADAPVPRVVASIRAALGL